MKRYAEYKDSGVAWIGEIPKEWEAKKMKYISRMKSGDSITSSVIEEDGDYPVYGGNGLRGFTSHYTHEGEYILVGRQGALCGNVRKVTGKFWPSEHAVVVYENNDINKDWYKHFLDDMNLNQYSTSAAQPGLSVEQIINLFACVPPHDNQQAIAAYLDKKTTAVDALIADKRRLIDLLKEKRQAIISEVVTKGLDPNVPMKDSGVEWIGEIPAHWDVKRFSQLFSFGRGLNITKADLEDAGVPCVSYGDIHSRFGFEVNPDVHALRCVSADYLHTSPGSLLQYGDFVFADTSEDTEGAGNFTYLNSHKPVFAGYHTVIARNHSGQNCRYLAYLFDSIPFRTQIRCKVSGIKVFSITQNIMKKVAVILPPLQEQEAIAVHLDAQTVAIDSLIADIATQIEKLKEYRQAIISEAVTGKVMITENVSVKSPQSKREAVFMRLVLSARILDNICDEPTAGRVKFEKLLYLSEHCAKLPLHSEFQRYAAGPYDPQALYSIEEQLKRNKWFGRNTDKSASKAYLRLSKADGYRSYVDAIFDVAQKDTIDKLIQLFKTVRTIQCEIVATLYGAWNDFLIDGIQPTDEQIVNEVLTNWHERKERIDRKRWLVALGWMKKQNIVPVGYGVSTKGGQY